MLVRFFSDTFPYINVGKIRTIHVLLQRWTVNVSSIFKLFICDKHFTKCLLKSFLVPWRGRGVLDGNYNVWSTGIMWARIPRKLLDRGIGLMGGYAFLL